MHAAHPCSYIFSHLSVICWNENRIKFLLLPFKWIKEMQMHKHLKLKLTIHIRAMIDEKYPLLLPKMCYCHLCLSASHPSLSYSLSRDDIILQPIL